MCLISPNLTVPLFVHQCTCWIINPTTINLVHVRFFNYFYIVCSIFYGHVLLFYIRGANSIDKNLIYC